MRSSNIPIRRVSLTSNGYPFETERESEPFGSIHDFGVPAMFDDLPFFDDFEYFPSSFKNIYNSPLDINTKENPLSCNELLLSPTQSRKVWSNMDKLHEKDSIRLHKDSITSMCISSDKKTLFTVSHDSHLKIYSLNDQKLVRSTKLSHLALSSCILTENQKHAIIGSWDNNIYMYSIEYGKVISKLSGHDDAVSTMILKNDNLLSGSWDSTIKLWRLMESGFHDDPLYDFSNLESEIISVDLDNDSNLGISGSSDGLITLLDFRMKEQTKSWKIHKGPVSTVNIIDDQIITTGMDGDINVIDMSGNIITNITSNTKPINTSCTNGYKIIVSGKSSDLDVWSLKGRNKLNNIKKEGAYVSCIIVDEDLGLMLTGSTDGYVSFWGDDKWNTY